MSESSPANRALVTRVLFGVTSVGAALGLLYLYYSRQRKKDAADSAAGGDAASSTATKKRRVTSGEKNRVTFSDQHEIIGMGSVKDQDYDADEEEVAVAKALLVENGQVVPRTGDEYDSGEESSSDSLLELEDEMVIHVTPGVEEEQIKAVGVKLNEAEVKKEDKNDGSEPVQVAVNGPSPATNATAAPPQAEAEPPKSAITPETDYDNASKIRHMMIPRDLVPGLIGKKGARIKHIQQTSNCVINFQDETLENGDRVCVIRGLPQDVTLAESMIEKFVMEQPVVSTHTISVPQSCVGRIIGKGGESIRQIQDMSKAKVTVDSQNHFSFHRPGLDSSSHRNVVIKGTEEQIEIARQLILAKVEEEQTLRRNIDIATQNRTPRRPNVPGASASPAAQAVNPDLSALNGNSLSLTNGELEVFVSCAYHPNDFFIQVMGRESIELDKLTEAMTDWYTQLILLMAGMSNPEDTEFSLGEIIAAPFDVDSKMYRGKIIKIANGLYEVMYVDYGDRRSLKKEELQKIHPEFLKLRFQAIQATLNLGCIGERWLDDAINDFCDLTFCAQWQSLRAKVKDYLKDPSDQRDTIWVEIFDKDNVNIGDELIRRGLAISLHDSPSASSAAGASSSSKKSYAAVVADENKTSSPNPDGSPEEPWDECNGNGN